jgi:hypothetical protein
MLQYFYISLLKNMQAVNERTADGGETLLFRIPWL